MLCGGSTLLPGFADRLRQDMKTSYETFINKNPRSDLDVMIKILAPPRRSINVFMGGAMFANILNGMKDMWITKKQYEESGFQIVQKKICNNLQLK
jgi:actin-related protein